MKSKLIITFILITIGVSGFSQEISFTYDESGNRTGRSLLVIGKIDNEDTGNENQNVSRQKEDLTASFENQSATIDDITIKVTPNPNGGKFSISISNLNDGYKAGFYLHSMSGTLVYECKKPVELNPVDMSNSENGTYILTVFVNRTKEAWKIIKQ